MVKLNEWMNTAKNNCPWYGLCRHELIGKLRSAWPWYFSDENPILDDLEGSDFKMMLEAKF